MSRLDALESFVAVVEAGGFSAASRRLGVPLATLSRRVSELEAGLRVRLLTRTTRRVVPTDAGRDFFRSCRRILEELEAAEREAAGEFAAPRGELAITAPIVFGRLHILPVVTEFLQQYPAIDVRLVLLDRVVELLDDRIDLAVRIGALPDSSLMAAAVGNIRRIVCASPAYLAANGIPRQPQDLVTHRCVSFAGLGGSQAWPFLIGRREKTVSIHSRLTVSTAEAAVDAAVAGVGITRVLSYQAAASIRARQLAVLLDKFELPPSPVHIVYPGGRLLPSKLRAFLDFALPRLKTRLATLSL